MAPHAPMGENAASPGHALREERPHLEKVDSKLNALAHLLNKDAAPSASGRAPRSFQAIELPKAPSAAAAPEVAEAEGGAGGPPRPKAGGRLPIQESFAYSPRFELRSRRASAPDVGPEHAHLLPAEAVPHPPRSPHRLDSPAAPAPRSTSASRRPPPAPAGDSASVDDRERAFISDFAAIRERMRQNNAWKFDGFGGLVSGEPMVDRVEESQFKFYRFDTPRGTNRIYVRLLALEGNPDLYASFIHDMPNLTQNQFYSDKEGDDELVITDGDPEWRDSALYIAVRGQTKSEFRLTAYHSSSVLLASHRDVPGRCINGMPAYYRLMVSDARQSAVIRIDQREEDIDELNIRLRLYVSTKHKFPSASDSEWVATDAGSSNGLVIDPNHPKFKTGWLYVAVDCDSGIANFTINGHQRKWPHDARTEQQRPARAGEKAKAAAPQQKGLYDRNFSNSFAVNPMPIDPNEEDPTKRGRAGGRLPAIAVAIPAGPGEGGPSSGSMRRSTILSPTEPDGRGRSGSIRPGTAESPAGAAALGTARSYRSGSILSPAPSASPKTLDPGQTPRRPSLQPPAQSRRPSLEPLSASADEGLPPRPRRPSGAPPSDSFERSRSEDATRTGLASLQPPPSRGRAEGAPGPHARGDGSPPSGLVPQPPTTGSPRAGAGPAPRPLSSARLTRAAAPAEEAAPPEAAPPPAPRPPPARAASFARHGRRGSFKQEPTHMLEGLISRMEAKMGGGKAGAVPEEPAEEAAAPSA